MVKIDAGKRGVSCSEVDGIPFYMKDGNHLYGGEDAGKRGVSCSEVDEIPFYMKDGNHLYGGEGRR